MNQKLYHWLIIFMLVFNLIFIIIPFSKTVKAEEAGVNIFVDPDQISTWYDATHVKTIAEGISNATNNDVVRVFAGTYAENEIGIDKEIHLIGNSSSDTIIDGSTADWLEEIFHITADNVLLSDFNFTGAQGNVIQIYDDANAVHNVTVQNCTIHNWGLDTDGEAWCAGVFIVGTGVVRNNTFLSTHYCNYGIATQSVADDNGYERCLKIYNNTFSNISADGTFIDYDSYIAITATGTVQTVLIYNNTMDDGHAGFYPFASAVNTVNISFYGNTVRHFDYGVYSGQAGFTISNVSVYDNVFNNDDNVNIFLGTPDIKWNTTLTTNTNVMGGSKHGGNYWSDYPGVDANSDGIGDTNFTIASADEHPLVINPPTNVATEYKGEYASLNLTWTLGENADTVVAIRNPDHYPTSYSDGTEVANSTNGFSNIPGVTHYQYYTLFGYNSKAQNYSIDGVDIEWAAMVFWVYNESNMSQEIPNWHILIKNEEGTQGYERRSVNNPLYISAADTPFGENSLVKVWKENFRFRLYTLDIPTNSFTNLTFYLPREKLEPGEEEGETDSTDCTLRGYVDSVFVNNPAVDATINLTYPLESIIAVEIYDNDLYGTYGAWLSIPNSNFTTTEDSVTITAATLDDSTSMARVNYYFEDCTGDIISSLYFIRIVESYETSYGFFDRPVVDAKVTFQRYNNNTGKFVNVSSFFTDANGYVNVYLFPAVIYQVIYEKDGYEDGLSDYVPPPPNEYGQTVEKSFRIIKTTTTSEPSITIYFDILDISPYNLTCFEINYLNLNNDNNYTWFYISDFLGSTQVETINISTFPNNISRIVNFSGYSLTGDLIQITCVAYRANGSTYSLTGYFNINQARQFADASMAPIVAIFSLGICLFGLTIAHPKRVFGFVGIITMIIALAITVTVQPPVWYITLVQAVELILLIIIFLIFREEGTHAF